MVKLDNVLHQDILKHVIMQKMVLFKRNALFLKIVRVNDLGSYVVMVRFVGTVSCGIYFIDCISFST